jgi:8-oxo-dGTP diphosphatase
VRTELEPLGAVALMNAGNASSELAEGAHLPQENLLKYRSDETTRPAWLTAACHDATSIFAAQALAVDAITVSPVNPTATHPQAQSFGWAGFSALLDTCSVPAFALGGVREAGRTSAYEHGAHGIAMMRP